MPMPYYRNTSLGPLFALLGMVIICLMIFFTPRFLSPTLTKITGKTKLLEFEKDFEKIKHPQGSERISMRSTFGNFAHGQKGCDFFVGEFRSYIGDKDAVQTGYSSQTVDNYSPQVVFLESEQFPEELKNIIPSPLNEVGEGNLSQTNGQQQIYLLYLVVNDYGEDLKMDCR